MFRQYGSFTILALSLISSSAFSFDESRKGFSISVGGGFHTIDTEFSLDGAKVASPSENGLATSLKIGGGVNEQVLLYYVRNASWYSGPYFDDDVTYTIGIGGFGVSYFLSPTAPSAYFLGAIGVGDMSAPFESHIQTDTGSAFMIGGGYEFKPHVQFEATILKADIDSADVNGLSVGSTSLMFTINYNWY